MKAYQQVAAQLSPPLRTRCAQLLPQIAARVTELRLRSGRPPAVTCGTDVFFLNECGAVQSGANGLPAVSHRQLQECFLHLCRYSVFTYETQLCRGYFTLSGGHRVGIASPAVWEKDCPGQPQSVTSMVIRIARTAPLQQPERWQMLLSDFPRLLLAGAPGSGKTTVLRALAEVFSGRGLNTAVLDERGELFPVDDNGFCLPVPCSCDVLSGYPKAVAIEQALRTLSPRVLLCDELGSGEAQGILDGLNGGVGYVATVHAGSTAELWEKPLMQTLTAAHAVNRVVFLDHSFPGRIRCVADVD